MAKLDWYPKNLATLRAWAANFFLRRPEFEAKYPILQTKKAELEGACNWLMWWIDTRSIQDEWSQQFTKYFNTIAGNDPDADVPTTPAWAAPPGMPPDVPPGIEKLMRDTRREVVNASNYATADGEAMGFEAPESEGLTPGDMTPAFELKTLAEFKLQATFRKLGMDGLKFQYRHKGGDWQPAATLISSPGTFTVPPAVPGEATQVEIRAIFLEGNNEVGNWSDAKSAFIAP